MPRKRVFQEAKSGHVFGQARRPPKMFRAGLYARVSTNDQQTLAMQNRAMREYAARRGWVVALQIREVNSGAARREAREKVLEAARRREIDVVLVWRLDRWGRSVTDLLVTLQELEHLGVGFVSLTEALDLTTAAGRAMAGLLAIFAEFEREILRERTRAGLVQARMNGKQLGRPVTAGLHAAEIRKLHRAGVAKAEIARRLEIGRTSVRRILASPIASRNMPGHQRADLPRGASPMPLPDPKLDQLLRTAIDQTRLLRLRYQSRDRIVEPHDYGVHKGVIKLFTRQVRGSSSRPLPGWRWMETDQISDAEILGETFPGGRPTPSGKHHQWDILFIRVKPSPENPD
jgi:DNA invertase Pin-like site-specific DNA recombinase